MGSDSPLSARMEAQLRSAGVSPAPVDRPQFFADVQALELRLAIIDDRFERLAARPEDAYRAWRRDTVARLRSVADRAGALEAAGALEPHRRRHVAALLTLLRRRIVQLDERHARFRDRRGRARDGPGLEQTPQQRLGPPVGRGLPRGTIGPPSVRRRWVGWLRRVNAARR